MLRNFRATVVLSLRAGACLPLICVVLLGGCAETDFDPGASPDGGVTEGGSSSGGACNAAGQKRCLGDELQQCDAGKWQSVANCSATALVCSEELRACAACDPGFDTCSGGHVHQCRADGTLGERVKECPSGQCAAGVCSDPCSQAEASRSYIGCEYWPTVTLNAGLAEDFSFAVVVANPQTEPVDVTVSSASVANVAQVQVPAESTQTIKLPWVEALKQKATSGGLIPVPVTSKSVLAKGGAYRLESSLPVTLYQFNPLNYVIEGSDCQKGADPIPGDGRCNSFSNDASLLLPRHVLTKEYMVLSRPTMMVRRGFLPSTGNPGFFSVVATTPGQTQVEIEFSANTQAGDGTLKAYSAGEKATFKLDRWDVLQIASQVPDTCTPAKTDASGEYCDLSKETDLTGTIVVSDQPVAVFGGHDCTFVPFDKWACDHLEEQLFPTATLGRAYVAAHTLASGGQPSVYRVVSAEEGNDITFSSAVHGPVTLGRGKFVEFTTDQDFEVKGSGRFALVQFMVGQGAGGDAAPGDPAMALAVPAEQFRTSYRFLAPDSFQQNYVNVVASSPEGVMLDGKAVTGFKQVPGSEYHAAKVEISGGSHVITSSRRFGISVYGVGSFTSYMYPGGLDLNLLQ